MTPSLANDYASTQGFEVLDKFWEHFFEASSGGTHPIVLPAGLLGHPLFTVADGMELTRALLEAKDVSLNGDGRFISDPVLPPPPDRFEEFEGYTRRLGELNGADSITFTRDHCLRYSNGITAKVRRFTHGYIRRVGLPCPGINAVFIGGRYRATWIGLHNDFCRTFLFPLCGRKRMMLWPPDYFQDSALEETPSLNGICFGHVDVSPYVNDSTVLEAAPGDLLYIPAHWWHYNFLEEPEVTMTLSLGVFQTAKAADILDQALNVARAMSETTATCGIVPSQNPSSTLTLADVALPQPLETLLHQLRGSLAAQLLMANSAGGVIGGTAGYRSTPLVTPSTQMSGRADSPVYFVSAGSQLGLVIAAGSMLRVAWSDSLRSFVDLLNSGHVFLLSDIQEAEEQFQTAISVAGWLYERGAIEINI